MLGESMKMNTNRLFKLLAICLIFNLRGFTQCSSNQKVCDALDDIFKRFYSSCTLPYPLTVVKKKDLNDSKARQAPVSSLPSIPTVLLSNIDNLHFSDGRRTKEEMSLARLLSQVFPDRKLDALKFNDYIGATTTTDPEVLKQIGVDGDAFTTSCQSTLEAGLDVDGQYSFPVATIKSALKASLNSNTKSGIVLSSGHFDSPLYVFLTDSTSSIYGYILMLGWRLNHNNPNGNLYYLAHVKALTSSQLSSSQMYADTALSAHLGISFGISTKSDAQFARNVAEGYSASFFTTVVENPQQSDFDLIPSVDDLLQKIAQYPLSDADVDTKTLLVVNDKAHVTQVVEGIPSNICNAQGWTWSVADQDSAQTNWDPGEIDRPQTKASTRADGFPLCTFKFDIKNRNTGAAQFTAQPLLKATNSSGGSAGTSFSLKLQKMTFTASKYPQLISGALYNAAGMAAQQNSADVWRYTIPIQVRQAPSGNGFNQFALTSPVGVICPNKKTLVLHPTTQDGVAINDVGVSQRDALLDFVLSDAAGTLDKDDPFPLLCTLNSGTVDFTDTTNIHPQSQARQIEDSLALKIKFPHVKPVLMLTDSTSGTSHTFSVTIQGIFDTSVIVGKPLTLYDGTAVLATATVKDNLSVAFPPLPLDSKVSHSITVGLDATDILSKTQSPAKVIPAQE
jgi:hypothetical protein